MESLTFADTHNMVTFLSKSDASKGFDQIVEFLNAHTIQYALVVNPTIYVSYIKQFWATVTIKKVNDAVQLRALIDGKKVVVTKDVIRSDLHLDDADGVECLPNEDIFTELARMGYEKPPPKLTFYKALFSAQWKFLIHKLVYKFNFFKYIFDNMVRNVDSPSKFLMYPHFLQVIMDNQGFSRVKTPLFASMLVQPQPHAAEEGEEVDVPNAPAPPSPTNASSPPLQDPTPTSHATPHALPPQKQPSLPHDSTMPLLTTLMETCASLSQKVAELEQDKHTQALEIRKLKKRVKKLEKKKRSKSSGFKRMRRVGTTQRVESSNDTIGRIDQEDVNAASKGVNAAEPTVFDDEEVTMTMAQTLIKIKAEKAKLLDEQIAQRLHDEEVKKAAARDKQEKDDMERAQLLQKWY
nr:hypothetical protein [Tanacetum cinerariifolium]